MVFCGDKLMNLEDRLVDNRIQLVLDKRNMTQKDLADRIEMYQSDINDIIKGKRKRFTLVNAAKIANELGYSVEYLWPGLFR